MSVRGKRVAVVGSGVSGLAAAWLLQYHGAKVTIFESESTCGGHTLTDNTTKWPVDLGFQVYNLTTYPHLIGWLEQLQIETEPSDMSFALSMDKGKLEWASHDLNTIFAQRKNVADLSFLGMMRDVVRFGREAPDVLKPENADHFKTVKLGDYLKSKKYGQCFIDNYVVPMCAAVWSVPGAQVLKFPVQMLVRFWVNHHLLDLFQRPNWRVIKGRSWNYVKAVVAAIKDVRTSTRVTAVTRTASGPSGGSGVKVEWDGGEETFDRVVLATHSDISRKMRGNDITGQEDAVLAAIPYGDNDIYLHTDEALMPRDKLCWASWNFIGTSGQEKDAAAVCVSYWLNLLQNLPKEAPPMFVTLNPPTPPAADKIIRRLSLAHPIFSFDSWEAQQKIPEIQGQHGIYYAGAWCGYGFHEDGMRAAVAAITAMGLPLPWVPAATDPKTSPLQMYFEGRVKAYAAASLRAGSLQIVLPNGEEWALGSGDPSSLAHRTVPPYPVPQHAAAGTSATAARSVLANCDQLQHTPPPARDEASVPLAARVRVLTQAAFRRVALQGSAGLLQAYAEREFEVSSLPAFAAVLVKNARGWQEQVGRLGVGHMLGSKALLGEHLQRGGGIDAVYSSLEQLLDSSGTTFHRSMLDESLSFGPAEFAPEHTSLEESQQSAADLVLDMALPSESNSVLQLGVCWGALMLRAMQRHPGLKWMGTTLSKHQLAHVGAAIQAQGLSDSASLRFADWRELLAALPHQQTFAALIAVDPATMVTLPGGALQGFFSTAAALLTPAGTLTALRVTVADDWAAAERSQTNFMKAHVVRGMHLPTKQEFADAASAGGFDADAATERDASAAFAATLRQWRGRLESEWHTARQHGAQDRDLRRYEMALALAAAAFEEGIVECSYVKLAKSSVKGASAAAQKLSDSAVMSRMRHHVTVTKPISSGVLAWGQCAALIIVGMLLNWLLQR